MKKERIDKLLMDLQLAPSRERAKAYIMAGKVLVNDQVIDKAGAKVDVEADIRVKGVDQPYVGRGGVKLKGAIESFKVKAKGKICLDIGASTGGFTDCLLQEGASYVFAVDVGHSQLHWQLVQDERVKNMESTNFRNLPISALGTFVDLAVCDVSFISLTKILEDAYALMVKGGEMLALIKPQFEAGKSQIAKRGLVKDVAVQERVIADIKAFAEKTGFSILGVEKSIIQGKKSGNQEYLLFLRK